MDESGHQPWLLRALLLGVVYAIVGIVFGALANPAVSHRAVVLCRLAAWVVSAVVYAAHIAYEHFRLGNSPRSTALHVAVAAAIGAFGLAVAANVHSLLAASGNRHLLLIALVAWPVITALPAFLVALAVSAALARLARNAQRGDREAFDRVLAKVPSVPSDPWDRWGEETPSKDESAEAE